MPGRYYLCPVLVFNDADGSYYAAKVEQYRASQGYQFVPEIPTDAAGTPLNNWALCHVIGNDFSALDADPDFQLVCDNPVSADLDVDIPDKLDKFLKKKGVKVQGRKVKKRALIAAIGKKLSKNFEPDNMICNRGGGS